MCSPQAKAQVDKIRSTPTGGEAAAAATPLPASTLENSLEALDAAGQGADGAASVL